MKSTRRIVLGIAALFFSFCVAADDKCEGDNCPAIKPIILEPVEITAPREGDPSVPGDNGDAGLWWWELIDKAQDEFEVTCAPNGVVTPLWTAFSVGMCMQDITDYLEGRTFARFLVYVGIVGLQMRCNGEVAMQSVDVKSCR